MSELINQISVWRLAITRITLFCFVAGATTFCTTMSGLEWSALSGTQKVITMLGVLVAMASIA